MVGERRCVSCGKLAPKAEFWRVVRTSRGEILLDQGMGRSAYICPNAQCLHHAKHRKRLARALKAEVPPEIFKQLLLRLDNNGAGNHIGIALLASKADKQAEVSRGSALQGFDLNGIGASAGQTASKLLDVLPVE
jgi:predicted RNA-binding protein YlxR (DUF448 family)